MVFCRPDFLNELHCFNRLLESNPVPRTNALQVGLCEEIFKEAPREIFGAVHHASPLVKLGKGMRTDFTEDHVHSLMRPRATESICKLLQLVDVHHEKKPLHGTSSILVCVLHVVVNQASGFNDDVLGIHVFSLHLAVMIGLLQLSRMASFFMSVSLDVFLRMTLPNHQPSTNQWTKSLPKVS